MGNQYQAKCQLFGRRTGVNSTTNPKINHVKPAYGWVGEGLLAYRHNKIGVLAGTSWTYHYTNIFGYNRTDQGVAFNVYSDKINENPYKILDAVSENWYNIYFQTDYQPFPFLKIDIGGQLNKTISPRWDFVPRINLVFNWQEKLYAKLLYNSAFRSPNMTERYNNTSFISPSFLPAVVGGGVSLRPEKITTSELQLAYKNQYLQLVATYFHCFQQDLIARSLPSDSLVIANAGNIGQKLPVPKQINKGDLSSRGVELEGRLTLSKHFYFTASATWTKVGDGSAEQPSFGMPNFMLKNGVTYELNKYGLTMGLFNTYLGKGDDIGVRFPNANPEVKDYNFMTLNLNWHLKKFYGGASRSPDLVLNFYATNLLDEQIYYPEYSRRIINSLPGRPQRAFYVSLQYRK